MEKGIGRLEKYYWLYIRVEIPTCAYPKLMPMYLNVNINWWGSHLQKFVS